MQGAEGFPKGSAGQLSTRCILYLQRVKPKPWALSVARSWSLSQWEPCNSRVQKGLGVQDSRFEGFRV